MALILSLETATSLCSVALHRGGHLISCKQLDRPQAHAEELAVMIQETLAQGKASVRDLHAVAVSAGPGSYTGLRIGVSTAKGLCYALRLPLLAVSTLEIMVESIRWQQEKPVMFCPMLDARRMEVYCQLFSFDGQAVSPVRAIVIDPLAFAAELSNGPVIFFGSGAAKCMSVIHHVNAQFRNDVFPNAKEMGSLALNRWVSDLWEDLSSYEPFYLKEFYFRKPEAAY